MILYCENLEGGMEFFVGEPEIFEALHAWMSPDTREEDTLLLNWARNALPGEWARHRLGIAVCVRNSRGDLI